MGCRLSLTVVGAMLATVVVLPASSLSIAAPNPVPVEVLTVPDQTVPDQTVDVQTSSGNEVYPDKLAPSPSPVADAPGEAVSNSEISYQMQILQQEVQALRGMVEKLEYQFSRMQSTQVDRYLELDQRFQRLSDQASHGSITPPADFSGGLPGADVRAPANAVTPANTSGLHLSEDANTLFDTALELIRSRQYDMAISQLQALIAQYPDSPLAAKAYYWSGEVYMVKPDPDYESARRALAQVITYFPEHRIVPDAAFKLGKVYHLIGDCVRSTELLRQIIEQQQGKSIARLAQTYLRDKVGNCQ